MASCQHEPSLTITADQARRLVPSIRHAYRALVSISAMHQATGLKRQALETSMAARRLLLLCGDLDALTGESRIQFPARVAAALTALPSLQDTGPAECSADEPGTRGSSTDQAA